MKLMTQEEGSQLKVGDFVKVYWFSPRKPKGEEPPSRQWEGRQEWVSEVWPKEKVVSLPYRTTHDGYAVKLENRPQIWLTNHMERVT